MIQKLIALLEYLNLLLNFHERICNFYNTNKANYSKKHSRDNHLCRTTNACEDKDKEVFDINMKVFSESSRGDFTAKVLSLECFVLYGTRFLK